ncbi:MAG TPA: glycosyltransferase family 39 protein [Candidatus Polarisedimenticolaceae bacterium]|nr:glycosyltransferase family 39 protein [Candidatus Polarisedimenticolaceae bacterium]
MSSRATLESRSKWILVAILAFALVVRLAHWFAVRELPFFAQLIVDSKVYDAWGHGIASGHLLGNGSTFQAPLYPYLLGGIYAVYGHRIDAVYLLQCLAALAGIWALYRAGREMGGERVGLISAGLAAAYGPFIFYDVQILKESLAVTAACFLLWSVAWARKLDRWWGWLVAGTTLGVLAAFRENAYLLLPFLLGLVFVKGMSMRSASARVGALLLGCALPLVPVTIRNGLVGSHYLPTTSSGGLNVYLGNNPTADGTYRPLTPGKQIPELEDSESARVAEQAVGRHLSPSEVSSYWLHLALRWAMEQPSDFLKLQARKLGLFFSWYEWPDSVDYYWTRAQSLIYRIPLVEFSTISLLSIGGLWVLWRRREWGAFAPAWVFALGWMFATIAFFLLSRYRLPGVPGLIVLSAMPITAVIDARRDRAPHWWIGATLVLVAFLLPFLPGSKARVDLVEYNLGRLSEDAGDVASAKRHYEAALSANPENFLVCMNLGTLAAQRQDWSTALAYYRRAGELETSSDDLESDLGAVLLALGEEAEAKLHLDRALSLNPRNINALHNGSVLALRSNDSAKSADLNRRLLEIDPSHPAGLRVRARLEAHYHGSLEVTP